jgi:hypothetical protein
MGKSGIQEDQSRHSLSAPHVTSGAPSHRSNQQTDVRAQAQKRSFNVKFLDNRGENDTGNYNPQDIGQPAKTSYNEEMPLPTSEFALSRVGTYALTWYLPIPIRCIVSLSNSALA